MQKRIYRLPRRYFSSKTYTKSSYERRIESILNRLGIEFEEQFVIPGTNKRMDYMLKKFGKALEIDGEQHFSFTKDFHKDYRGFRDEKQNDINKTLMCLELGIPVIRLDCTLSDDKLIYHLLKGIESGLMLYTSNKYLYKHISGALFG